MKLAQSLVLAAAAVGVSGCLERPVGTGQPRTTNVIVDNLIQSAVDKIDLLFMIDNSMSMADKQKILEAALPDLVGRLVDPRCLTATEEEVDKVDGECPIGSAREFQPISNIHIGVITSSLGGFGAELNCVNVPRGSDPLTTPPDPNLGQVDVSHLMGSLPRGMGTGETSASNPFLSWCVSTALENNECPETMESGTSLASGATDGDINRFAAAFKYQVVQAGETGCGFEASLEAWYRFLIEPSPWKSVMRQPCGANEQPGQNLCVGPTTEDGTPLISGGRAEIDQVVLDQRKAFLRPDSLLAVIMLTDENDCSFKVTGQSWRLSTTEIITAAGSRQQQRAFKGTPQCLSDANDPCCYSCGLPPRNNCPSEVNAEGQTVGQGCGNRVYDPTSDAGPTEDAANLRCFDQKRRFGVDYLFPVERYVNALRQDSICLRNPDGSARDDLAMDGCAADALIPNPLFQDLKFVAGEKQEPTPVRAGDLVFLAGIVGVPWQDLAVDHTGATPLVFRVGIPDLPNSIDWGLILGTKGQDGKYQPGDPLMREQIEPRSGSHPLTGQAVADTSAGYMANAINGHEWNIADRDDLQYACIFEMADSVDCTMNTTGNCDCEDPRFADPLYANPLCQNPQTGTYGTRQYYAKAYPSIRVLEVLQGYGSNSIVASICPKEPINTNAPDYGYRPAVAAIVDRLKDQLKDKCLPRPLEVKTNPDGSQSVPCRIIEASQNPTAASCSATARSPVDPQIGEKVYERLARLDICTNDNSVPGLPDCTTFSLCEIAAIESAADYNSCLNDDVPTGHGWCYVDPDNGLGSPKQVEKCPVTERRKIRFAGAGAPEKGTYTFFACSGATTGSSGEVTEPGPAASGPGPEEEPGPAEPAAPAEGEPAAEPAAGEPAAGE